MRSFLLTLLLLIPSYLFSEEMCELENKSAKLKLDLGKEVPDYFFKVIMPQNEDDARDEVTAILNGKGNVLIDMKTGEVKKIPGLYDAVPSIDAKIITVPGNPENRNHFTIMDRDRPEQILYQDKGRNALLGTYQSVGLLSSKSNEKTYRVITDTVTMVRVDGTKSPSQFDEIELENGSEITVKYPDKLHFKDYIVKDDGEKILVDGNSTPAPLCPNMKELLKLPMLSKDGTKLVVYNVETGTTQVYKIKDGKCDLEKDLGFATSKAEFSKDGSKITFAADTTATNYDQVRWRMQPHRKLMKMNVYVFDLKTDELTKVTNNVLGSSYYPSFSKDDTVTYLQQDFPEGLEKKAAYSIVRARIDKTPKTTLRAPDFYSFDSCLLKNEDLALLALGKLWVRTCLKFVEDSTVMASNAIALSLDPNKCQELVKDYWELNRDILNKKFVAGKDIGTKKIENYKEHIAMKNFENLRQLSQEDLLNACPKNKTASEEIEVKKVSLVGEFGGGNILFNKCAGCHSAGNGRAFVVDRAHTIKKYKNKAIEHINSGYMPMGDNPLTPEDKEKIIEYLNRF